MQELFQMAGIYFSRSELCCTLCTNLFDCSHISILDGSHVWLCDCGCVLL